MAETLLRALRHWFAGQETMGQTMSYGALIDEIEKLGKLPRGWNTYRADAVPFEARRRAISFVELLSKLHVPAPPPSVTPTSNGGVALHWETNHRDVLIIFLSDGGEYSVSDPDSEETIAEGPLGRVDLLREVVPHIFA
jgi:hypothetical protein